MAERYMINTGPTRPTEEDARNADFRAGYRAGKAETEVEIARLREALEAIADDDALLDANEEAFNVHAARRMQARARAALAGGSE